MSHFSPGLLVPAIASISYLGTRSSSTSQTTYTFSTLSFGAETPSRFMLVGTGMRNVGQSVSSMTIGGVSASLTKRQIGTQGFNTAEMWGAYVPTGATGDVVITWSSSIPRCAMVLYKIIDIQSLSLTTTAGSTSDPLSTTVAVKAGGVVAAFSYGSSDTTNTWTGLTEDVDTEVATQTYSSASAAFLTDQSSLSVTCDGAAAYADPVMVVAAFR